MKKVSILLFALLVSFTSFAQVAVEINFDPLGAFASGLPTFSANNGLKVRYFLSDDFSVRGTVNFLMNPNTEYTYVPKSSGNGDIETKTKTNVTTFRFTPGIEYHLAKFDKGSVYAGAEVGFGMTNASYNQTNDDNDEQIDIKGSNGLGAYPGARSNTRLGLGVFTGVDYYMTKNLYLGVELGLSYISTTNKKIVRKDTPATGSSTETITKDHRNNSSLGFDCTPAFRLGWTF